jgi:peptidoglycan/xylan/chitin deacetylase (PgdA/CDA1 family)/uncharacterized membrane protein YbhN (UPF0104 family)
MRKRQVLIRYVSLAAAGAAVVVVLDLLFVHLHAGSLAWLLDVTFATALVLTTIGCFAPNSPIFGRVVDGSGVSERVVAITFDDGPSPDTTPRILDALRDADRRATFFVLGRHAELYPEVVERIVREGHEVANHGYSHGILVFASPRRITGELARTQRLLQARGAAPVRYFRAPHGFRNPFVVRVARRLGYRVVGWTKGVFDTALPGVDVIVQRSRDALRPGAILLLHDADGNGDGDRSQTAAALPAILAAVDEGGYEAVTVGELAALAPVRRTSWKRLVAVIIIVVAVVSIGFERLDRQTVTQIWDTFRTLSVPLVVAALVANLVSVWFKAVVWKSGLDTIPGRPPFRYRQIVPAIFIGFLLNSVLVARLGEVGRMFVLRRRVQKDEGVTIPMATIAGTVVMEQVILGITLIAIVIGMVLLLPSVPTAVVESLAALLIAVGALVLAVVAVALLARWRHHRRPDDRPDESVARSWRSFLRSADAIAHEMSRGQRLLRDPARTLRSLGGGLLSWVAQVLGIWLTLRAFGIDHHALGASAVVFLASNVVGLIPVTPGNVLTFQLAVAAALYQVYGVDPATGTIFATGLQAIEIALGAGLGVLFLSLEGLSFGEVRRGITAAERDEADELVLPREVPGTSEPRRLVV